MDSQHDRGAASALSVILEGGVKTVEEFQYIKEFASQTVQKVKVKILSGVDTMKMIHGVATDAMAAVMTKARGLFSRVQDHFYSYWYGGSEENTLGFLRVDGKVLSPDIPPVPVPVDPEVAALQGGPPPPPPPPRADLEPDDEEYFYDVIDKVPPEGGGMEYTNVNKFINQRAYWVARVYGWTRHCRATVDISDLVTVCVNLIPCNSSRPTTPSLAG